MRKLVGNLVGDLVGHLVGHLVGNLVGNLVGHFVGNLVGTICVPTNFLHQFSYAAWSQIRGPTKWVAQWAAWTSPI